MSTLAWALIGFILGGILAPIIVLVAKSIKNKDPLVNVWIKIRPLLSEVFIEAVKIYQAEQLGYEALVAWCVDYIMRKIASADWLLPEEKALITAEFIRGIVEPQLKKIWENNLLSNINDAEVIDVLVEAEQSK